MGFLDRLTSAIDPDRALEIAMDALIEAAGARYAFITLLRLPAEVKDVFFGRLAEAFPERVDRVRNALVEMRGGALNDARFGHRMGGVGKRWAMVEQMFELQCKRLGINVEEPRDTRTTTFRRPTKQLTLFG